MNYNDDSNDSNDSNITLLSLLTDLNPYSETNETNDYSPLNLECSLNSCPYKYSQSNQYFEKRQEPQSQQTTHIVSIPTISPSTTDPMPTSCPCSIAFSDTICIPQGVMHSVNEGTKKVLKPIHINSVQNNNLQKLKTHDTMQQKKNQGGLCVIC